MRISASVRRVGFALLSVLVACSRPHEEGSSAKPQALSTAVHVNSAPAVAGPGWPGQVLVAQNSTELFPGSAVVGDAVVVQRHSGPTIGDFAVAQLDSGTQIAGSLSADTIQIQPGSTITADARFNTISGGGVVRGARFSPLALPVQVSLPQSPRSWPARPT